MTEPPIDPRIDELCDQFEQEFRKGTNPQLEDFVQMVDEHQQASALYWLLKTEQNLLGKTEANPRLEELISRFPGCGETIELCLNETLDQRIRQPEIPGYQLKELIGSGGQGGVYVATQLRTGQEVALKFISGRQFLDADNEATRQLEADFDSEAGIVSMLRHPNSIRLYDGGSCDGGAFLVMELVRGGNLAERRLQLNQYEAAELIRMIAEAVAEAHQFKVLHLDIKPQNILFDEHTSLPRLVDFGLAKWEAIGKSAEAIAGTPGYMAPEQANFGPLDERTDVFGLGATLYFLLTGNRPISGDTVSTVMENSRQPEILAPSLLNSNVNREIERICMKCLQASPADRYQDTQQLAEDLRLLKKRRGTHLSVQMANAFLVVAISFLILNSLTAFLISRGAPEPAIWLAAFSIYGPFFTVFYLYPIPKSDSQTDTNEAIWAIWLGKLIAEICACIALRTVIEDVDIVLKIAYPMFFAFSGMAICCMGFHFWQRFYAMAAFYWLLVPVTAWLTRTDAAWGPILYASTSIGLVVYSLHLKKVAKEVGSSTSPDKADDDH